MKKYLVLLASAALLFALLAGCNSENNNPLPVESTTAVSETQTPELTVAPTEATEAQTTPETKQEEKTAQPPTKAVEQLKEKNTNNNTLDKTKETAKQTEKAVNSDVKITKEEAKKAVLTHAGLAETDIKFYKAELDRERYGLVYEIEFVSGKYEYDYEIDAESGKIIKSEKEFND